MQDVTSGESVTTESSESANETVDQQTTDVVVDRSAEEYARKLKAYANENEKRRAQEKALKKQLDEAQAKLKQAQEEKLKEQGQWQQAYETSKKGLEEAEQKLKKIQATFAFKTVTAQIKEAAAKAGCVDTDSLIQLATAKGMLDSLEPDDEFNLPQESIKSIVSESQKTMSYLYGKQAPTLRDGTPPVKPDTKVGFDQLPLKERTLKLAELLVKQQQRS